MRGLQEGGAVLPSFPNTTRGRRPCGQVAKLPQARAWCEIRVAAGTGADVMAGGAGASGPPPDVLHQPPGTNTHHRKGYPNFTKLILGYPKNQFKKKDIPRYPKNNGKKKDIPSVHGISFFMQKSQG